MTQYNQALDPIFGSLPRDLFSGCVLFVIGQLVEYWWGNVGRRQQLLLGQLWTLRQKNLVNINFCLMFVHWPSSTLGCCCLTNYVSSPCHLLSTRNCILHFYTKVPQCRTMTASANNNFVQRI